LLSAADPSFVFRARQSVAIQQTIVAGNVRVRSTQAMAQGVLGSATAIASIQGGRKLHHYLQFDACMLPTYEAVHVPATGRPTHLALPRLA